MSPLGVLTALARVTVLAYCDGKGLRPVTKPEEPLPHEHARPAMKFPRPLKFRPAAFGRVFTSGLLFTAAAMLPLHAQTTVVANDVVINGESFFAASNIRTELTRLAREDSVIGQTETFRQVAVSGALIAQILGYYRNAEPKPTYVISDGGGNDLMGACPGGTADCPVVQNTFNTVKAYFDTMAVHGTKKVLWMRYPDPQGASWATLKTNQDLFNPLVKALCDTISLPKCLWIDLRPVWDGHYAEYTTDGIHATDAGGSATAEAFWKVMVDSGFFEMTPTSIGSASRAGVESFGARVTAWGSGRAGVNVRVLEAGQHAVSVHDASGRLIARRQGAGMAEYSFPTARRAGLYFVRVKANGRETLRKVFVGSRPN